MSLNELTYYPHSKRYYLTHPWKIFKQMYRNCRAGWLRATRGYSYGDKWDMDTWFLEIIPNMLDDLADTGCSYPGTPEFPTHESWKEYLHKLASDLRLCTEDAADGLNEYYDDFVNNLKLESLHIKDENGNIVTRLDESPEHKELSRKYFDRCKEISEEQEAIREEAFARLAHILPTLWD